MALASLLQGPPGPAFQISETLATPRRRIMLLAHPEAPQQDLGTPEKPCRLPVEAHGRIVSVAFTSELVAADYHGDLKIFHCPCRSNVDPYHWESPILSVLVHNLFKCWLLQPCLTHLAGQCCTIAGLMLGLIWVRHTTLTARICSLLLTR